MSRVGADREIGDEQRRRRREGMKIDPTRRPTYNSGLSALMPWSLDPEPCQEWRCAWATDLGCVPAYPMKTLSPDTTPDAEAVWIRLLKEASVCKRLRAAFDLTATARRLSWQGLARRYPEDSEDMRKRRFVALQYGEDLARRLFRSRKCRDG